MLNLLLRHYKVTENTENTVAVSLTFPWCQTASWALCYKASSSCGSLRFSLQSQNTYWEFSVPLCQVCGSVETGINEKGLKRYLAHM